jgi:hypothetical protein
MATSISAFQCVIPSGTSAGSPHVTNLRVRPDPIESIHWRVPPGPRGHLGWWLTQSGVPVLPDALGAPMVADGEWDTWQLGGLPESGAWACVGYNTGSFDHTVYLEFAYAGTTAGGGDGGAYTLAFPTADVDLVNMWSGGGGGGGGVIVV